MKALIASPGYITIRDFFKKHGKVYSPSMNIRNRLKDRGLTKQEPGISGALLVRADAEWPTNKNAPKVPA